jgi:hypothetical protein
MHIDMSGATATDRRSEGLAAYQGLSEETERLLRDLGDGGRGTGLSGRLGAILGFRAARGSAGTDSTAYRS